MSAAVPELQPDPAEVLQVEEPAGAEPTVNVDVKNPVRTQALPRKSAATRTVSNVAALPNPYRILSANPRRASAIVIANDPIFVAFSHASAQDPSTMAAWPAGTPLTVTAAVDIYVAAQTGTTVVSVISEQWATGEGAE